MTRGRRPTPARGVKSGGGGSASRPPLDLLQVAAEIVATLPDAMMITGTDRRILAANQPAADLLSRTVA